jgi:hypothetical protein
MFKAKEKESCHFPGRWARPQLDPFAVFVVVQAFGIEYAKNYCRLSEM